MMHLIYLEAGDIFLLGCLACAKKWKGWRYRFRLTFFSPFDVRSLAETRLVAVDSLMIVWHKAGSSLRERGNSSVFMCCAVNASSLIRDLITHRGSHLNLLSEGILIEHWQTSSEQMGTGNAKSCACKGYSTCARARKARDHLLLLNIAHSGYQCTWEVTSHVWSTQGKSMWRCVLSICSSFPAKLSDIWRYVLHIYLFQSFPYHWRTVV